MPDLDPPVESSSGDPASGLRRGPGGSFILDEPTDDAEVPGVTRRRRAAERASATVEVGGPIHPDSTIHFGRPPGTENRRAGGASLIAAGALAVAAGAPWAVRSPSHLDPTQLGWRDANGAAGPGWVALALAVVVLGLAAAALRGRTDPWMRWADVVVGVAVVVVGTVEGLRIHAARSVIDEISEGRASLMFGWGLLALVVGVVALGVAAVLHRSQPPAWRQP